MDARAMTQHCCSTLCQQQFFAGSAPVTLNDLLHQGLRRLANSITSVRVAYDDHTAAVVAGHRVPPDFFSKQNWAEKYIRMRVEFWR
jgi:hypothetical protein